ncbi:GntR family transcriptional regulator [Nakamurella endophytica]|uniref:GntR family transcriptional regulator n=1 Tax=Nakamurella endophytica TaxID=1748367 RepID=A0A917TBL8_9ACTN|nr:GntR family transcriptional regulator [Nakamurella endophytica]GGM16299.1 GntR family transcriptional regulator [Nakamurella endophytica]
MPADAAPGPGDPRDPAGDGGATGEVDGAGRAGAGAGLRTGPALRAVGARPSLRDEAIATLQAAIVAGELRPGVLYSAPTLAAQLGMSATPVREAMLDLVKEGLVETVRNKGFRVVELSDAELDELTALRLLVEVPTVADVARRGVSRVEAAELRQLADRIDTAAAAQDLIALNRADLEFHSRLLALAGNRALVELVRTLRTRSRLYGQARLADAGALHPTAHEHAEIVDLVAAGDADGAAELMRRHIGHVRGAWATGRPGEQQRQSGD